MNRRAVLAGAGSIVAGSLAGCMEDFVGEPVTSTFSDSYSVSPETTVMISNRNGRVTVEPATGDQLTITGEKQASSQEGLDGIDIEVIEGERFVINVLFSAGSDFSNRSVALTVGIPEGVSVDNANTANGTVSVTGVRGDLDAATINGNVDVTDVAGHVRGETVNGNVRIRDTTGITGARTTNGSVDVELLSMRDDVSCISSNGNVTVRVGPEVSVAFRLSTNTGSAEIVDLPFTPSTERAGYLTGSLRDGDSPTLSLSTNNGDVTLRPSDESA